jgi:sec-independent protein translocase protein TatB
MFGVGIPELFLIGIIALVVFGPEKLPELAKTFGRLSGQAKKTSDQVRREFYNAVYTPAEELRREIHQEQRQLLTDKPFQNSTVPESPSTTLSAESSSFESEVPKPKPDPGPEA